MLDVLIKNVRCAQCRGNLHLVNDDYECVYCGKHYQVKDGAIIFINSANRDNSEQPKSDDLIFRLKSFIKTSPVLFHILNHTLGTFVGKSAKRCIAHLPKGSLIVNIGSGAQIIRDDVINLDYVPHRGVRIVADAHNMPFKDNSVDAVISESVLEHVKYPEAMVKEMHRILKPGGLLYVTAPFVCGFHSSPDDYYRWTSSGLRELLKDFPEQEFGIVTGPTNACTYILREWLAIALSFNSTILYQLWLLFFMVIFAPLNLLDYILVHFKSAKNMALIFYYIGKK